MGWWEGVDETRVLIAPGDWANQLRLALSALDKNYAARGEKDTLADAVSILGECLKDEPWLRLDLHEINRKAHEAGIFPCVTENNSAFCDESEDKKSNMRSTRTGRQTKKAKMETFSKHQGDVNQGFFQKEKLS